MISTIKKLRGNLALGKALSVSALNQVVSSGTNFAIVLYLVRVMEKPDFGLYSLGFALILLLAGLISSSIAVQFVVNLPDQPREQRGEYAMHHSTAVFVLGTALVIVGLLIVAPSAPLHIGGVDLQKIVLPLVIAAAFYSQRDMLMRVAYAERREIVVLASTLAVTGGVAGVFIYQSLVHQPISAVGGLFAIVVGQLSGCVAALLLLRLPYKKLNFIGLRHAFTDSWSGGRWNILTNIVYNLRAQAHNFVVAPLLGMAALAEINAARVLVTPAVMAIPPLTQILMPRLADKRNQGVGAITRYAVLAIGGLAAVSLLYSLLLLTALPWVLPLTLGGSYQNVGGLVIAWCLVTVVLALRNGLTIVLQVIRAFRDLLIANVAAAVMAIGCSIALATSFGSLGAIIALAVAEIGLCVFLVKLLRKRLPAPSGIPGGARVDREAQKK